MQKEIAAIYKETVAQLVALYEKGEAESLTDILFVDLLGITKIHRLRNPTSLITISQQEQIQHALGQLIKQVPVQHLTGFTYFMGRRFNVTPDVLIPRPETEELVALILQEAPNTPLKILDIGTGSGCLAITLKLGLKGASVTAIDISASALVVATENAQQLSAHVDFRLLDILLEPWTTPVDLIVSNPPYIPFREKKTMDKNVVSYEPELALFVPDDDPLIFYRKIGEVGIKCLTKDGKIYVEVHEDYAIQTESLFLDQGYHQVRVYQDLNSKNRMVSAVR